MADSTFDNTFSVDPDVWAGYTPTPDLLSTITGAVYSVTPTPGQVVSGVIAVNPTLSLLDMGATAINPDATGKVESGDFAGGLSAFENSLGSNLSSIFPSSTTVAEYGIGLIVVLILVLLILGKIDAL